MAATSFGGTIKLTGESEYKKALKDITSDLKLMSSELKLATTQFSNGDTTIKQTKNSYDNINKSVQDQKEKISELREALKKAEQEYGSNNEKVKAFKTQLNNAENQLVQMESATNKSTEELKEMKKGFDDAGDGALKFGDVLKANLLSDAILDGIKSLGSVVKEIGSIFVDVGKKALDSYADYEQLIGGVQTLFGIGEVSVEEYAASVGKSVKDVQKKYDQMYEAQESVLNYADKAYETAGLSANEYMETVTSFSASLIQSLKGNTLKSADYANRAIIDMSDNANKMGTDIALIQSAYQGFAKQNYTMLDNLKLGYGGTKTEMERLVKDASKMKDVQKELGVSVDSSSLSFGNIVNAISVMQSKMGISGTTAKEASSTIQGSVNSLKAVWQNMLTTISSESDTFMQQQIENLVSSIETVAENIMPRVQIIIDGIVDLVIGLSGKLIENMPQIMEAGMQILQKLLDGITSMLPQITPVIFQIIDNIVQFLTQNLPTILTLGTQILFELMRGIAESLPDLVPQIVDVIIKIMEVFNDNFSTFLELGVKVILGLIEGLIKSIPTIISNLPTIIEAIINFFTLSKFLTLGKTIISGLIKGLGQTVPNLLKEIPKIVGKIIKGFANGGWKTVGQDIIKGIVNGFTSMGNFIWDAIKKVGSSMLDGIKSFFGIKSPSRVMKDQVGTYLAEGIGIGFEDTMKNVSKDMANAIPTDFDTTINANYKSSSYGSNGYSSNNYDVLVSAFKEALKDTKVVMNGREMGNFIVSTMESAVYS